MVAPQSLRRAGPRPLQAARKPDSVLDDHSSRRRVAAPLQQPTRKFRLSGRSQTKLSAWAHRADTLVPAGECGRDPCLFGLAPCGVYHAAAITDCPVRSYRTFSPLPPAVCPAWLAPRRPFVGGIFSVALAVFAPWSANPGRYPAHCPAESGLSSPSRRAAWREAWTREAAIIQPPALQV